MSITKRWVDHWQQRPSAVLIADPAADVELTGADLDGLTRAWAQTLAEHGVGPGDRVAFACRQSAAAAAAYIGILRLGAVVVAINPTSTAAELNHFATLSQPVLAITDNPVDWTAPTLAPFQVTPLEAANESELELDSATEGQTALICFTSGTTGMPKGVPLTHANLAAGMAGLQEAWQWTNRDVLVSALPLFHIHGLVVALSTSLHVGGTIVIQQQFDTATVVRNVREHRASMFFAVPTMWWRLDRDNVVGELAGLRMATSGSAPLDPGLFERLASAMGQPPVERYGMSETVILTSNPVEGTRKPGSVGLALPGVELRISEANEVEVRGLSVISGYLLEASADSFSDGWFKTGDIGHFDEDGYLVLDSRKSELIITGGHNVAPREVEEAIRTVDGVEDVVVVGRPDPQWGEVIVGVVVPATAESRASGLEVACERELANYKRPREWHFVDELPRNSLGKVQRHRIMFTDSGMVIR